MKIISIKTELLSLKRYNNVGPPKERITLHGDNV